MLSITANSQLKECSSKISLRANIFLLAPSQVSDIQKENIIERQIKQWSLVHSSQSGKQDLNIVLTHSSLLIIYFWDTVFPETYCVAQSDLKQMKYSFILPRTEIKEVCNHISFPLEVNVSFIILPTATCLNNKNKRNASTLGDLIVIPLIQGCQHCYQKEASCLLPFPEESPMVSACSFSV